ncbi:MAG TPA: DUF6431 domain-containing protein [Pseudonocardiaceae bacterium]
MSVDAYALAGRGVRVPRPDCAACGAAMTFWSGYWRHVRAVGGRCSKIFVPRARCAGCAVTHALLPGFVLAHRVDEVATVGTVLELVIDGPGGVRPAAERVGVPHTTARGWLRRLGGRATRLAVGFAALVVELGGDPVSPGADVRRWALAAIRAAFRAATALPGWAALGRWRFVCCVSGGRLLAANTAWPYLVVGKRRFLPPVPAADRRDGGRDGP